MGFRSLSLHPILNTPLVCACFSLSLSLVKRALLVLFVLQNMMTQWHNADLNLHNKTAEEWVKMDWVC